MKMDYVKNLKDILLNALGYKGLVNKSLIDLINEIVAKNKSDNAVLKLREEECKKLREQVEGYTQLLNKLYGDASMTAVIFNTPVGNIAVETDLNGLNDIKYIRGIYNELRDRLKDALNEIDSLREDLAEERKDRKAAENESDTYSAIVSCVYGHFNDSMNLDSEEFQNIVDYCREWI